MMTHTLEEREGGTGMTIGDAVLLPLIVGLVELLKYVGIPKRVLPIASLIFGVLGGVIYIQPDDWRQGILVGVMMGLSACGMYSGGKAIMEQKDNDDGGAS